MDSNKSTNTPINKALLEHCEDSLSKSLPSNNGFRRTTKEKSLAERRKSKLDNLFNKKENQTSTPSSKYSTPTARSQICSEDEYDDSFHGPYNPPETNLLLQNCYSSIANLREEVDSLRLRNHDFQNKLDAAEEAKRQLTLERNRLQQQLLQTSQDLSSQQSRAQSLNAEVDSLDLEIDKLKRENLRLRKLNFKSEEFQDKIYELETELNRSQRARKVLENKYSQLKVHHEKLRKDNKKLQVSIKKQNSDNTTYEKVAWLKESNEKLSQALHEVTSLAADPNHLQNQVTTLISVVKELSATNGRLKAEVMQCCDALSDYHGVHQVHPDGILLTTTSPKNDRPKKHRFNSLPFIKSTSKDSASDNQDEPSPTIMNLFDDLKRALPEEISPKEMVKTLRHSASVGSGKLNSTCDFNQRDSGIYTTQSSLKQFYEDKKRDIKIYKT
ncbi:hypothetical protein K502DRAFT_68413 [Neoconidiobolus thromboides FSU 785]|nr:hypothetical protein K502DRAFT_68413 [Neoconidiobolus thromboides FSU 785]